ncbi:MAG: DUF3109 family protein [Cytophagaceae bacterium]
MIVIGNTVISDDVADKKFVCDLIKCKGACCVEGDAGAPLNDDELPVFGEIFEQVKPYLSKEGLRAIKKQGFYVKDQDDEYSTPTINGRECAYAIYDKNGILKCAIEQAWIDGKITYKKPISCHLYPIRITRYDQYDAVNYERWHICKPACRKGEELGIPVYKFLKDPLIRKYGEDWYRELCEKIEKGNDE